MRSLAALVDSRPFRRYGGGIFTPEPVNHVGCNHRHAVVGYRERGRQCALALGNRGPMRFDDDGTLEQDILDAYRRTGFYVFTNVLSAAEVAELTAEIDAILDNAPVTEDGETDQQGRPVRFPATTRSRRAGTPTASRNQTSSA